MALERINPRNLREKYASWVGKRVNIGLVNLHYICGTWSEMGDSDATFKIGGKQMKVLLREIASVVDADPVQADFFK